MNDHSQRIATKKSEEARIAEMERKSAPLFWLVFVIAAVVCVAIITKQDEQYDERASFRESVFRLNQQYIESNPKVKKIVYGRKG